MQPAVRIGELARQTGVSLDAIRFYEREGLLKHPPRSPGGYRLFNPGDLRTLQLIRKAQALGFSLSEIRELLLLRDERLHCCQQVRDLLSGKLSIVRAKIAELRSLEKNLRASLGKCQRELKTNRNAHKSRCPVLDEISNNRLGGSS